mmetsp:Transcript_6651/g.9065  ORF Transcript_6651/g.9065 Transcript_6651/m.9065 type:complete len:132 (-) Transcript_6651:380-775(-)
MLEFYISEKVGPSSYKTVAFHLHQHWDDKVIAAVFVYDQSSDRVIKDAADTSGISERFSGRRTANSLLHLLTEEIEWSSRPAFDIAESWATQADICMLTELQGDKMYMNDVSIWQTTMREEKLSDGDQINL